MKPNNSLETYLQAQKQRVDSYLRKMLLQRDGTPGLLQKAMQYSALSEGKRLRPILCLTAFYAVGGKGNQVLPAAAALELLHAFSLVHDDLPCMDDDDLRRGKLTLHKVYGPGMAVLAGDALHALAFQLLASTNQPDVIKEVATAIGSGGMIGGQVADILAEGKRVKLAHVEYIHRHKTAALIRASVRIGGILGSASTAEMKALTVFGEKIGLAFQVIDDILNVEGHSRHLGKKTGSDNLKEKATYPKAVGLEKSRQVAVKLTSEGQRALKPLKKFARLSQIADYLLKRIR